MSDGLRLGGSFYLPAADAAPWKPVLVVPCSGFTGLRHIHPARFARALTQKGFPCFGFDYRGFADSQGERHRVVLDEQIRDIRSAVAFARTDERFANHRVVLLGWGMAGGLILDAARELEGVTGLISANGFFDGARVQLAHRGPEGLAAFRRRVADEAAAAARSQQGHWRTADPFDLYPLDAVSRVYVDDVLRPTPSYDAEPYSYELGESLLRFRPEAYAPQMKLPLLIAHGDRNELHPVSEARSLAQSYGGPVELFWLEGAGHTEFMHDDNPLFQRLAARISEWLSQR